jgi:hypothetical protein
MKALTVGFWVAAALLCLVLAFNVWAQLALPVVAENFTRMGFPGYFRVELAVAKALAVVTLLLPMAPARLKEWAYAGVFINLASALVAHASLGDAPAAWGFAAVTSVLWALSYGAWRRLEVLRGSAAT